MTSAARAHRLTAHPKPRLIRRLFALLALRRTRARLAVLDDHLLDDIGLTRDEARAEAHHPPWDAPDHWTRP